MINTKKQTPMKRKVYGILGIASIMSNFNADFTGNPRRFNETYFASSMAGKYPIRSYWNKNKDDEKVFFIKSLKVDQESLKPRQLLDRYEQLFGEKANTTKNTIYKIKKNMYTCIDVLNFGCAFAVEKNNFSIAGAVQLTEGYNKFDGTETIREDILSPFANSKKDDADQTTLGSRSFTNEAHYFYGISICPNNYKEDIGMLDGFVGYTEEAYELFKEGCMYGVNELNSMSKAGCENEFALFVELNDDAKCAMANLHMYVDFEKKDKMGAITLNRLFKYLDEFKASINKVQIYYNPCTIEINIIDDKGVGFEKYSILNQRLIEKKEKVIGSN